MSRPLLTTRRNLGEINNPDIAQIIRAIVRAAKRWGCEALVVWKTDLKGAFNLLHFRMCISCAPRSPPRLSSATCERTSVGQACLSTSRYS
jgi:hypothetical protein